MLINIFCSVFKGEKDNFMKQDTVSVSFSNVENLITTDSQIKHVL